MSFIRGNVDIGVTSGEAERQLAALDIIFPPESFDVNVEEEEGDEEVLPAVLPQPTGSACQSLAELSDSLDYYAVNMGENRGDVIIRLLSTEDSGDLRVHKRHYSFELQQRPHHRESMFASVLAIETGISAVLSGLITEGLVGDIQVMASAPGVDRVYSGVHVLSADTIVPILVEILDDVVKIQQSSSRRVELSEFTFSFTLMGGLHGEGKYICVPTEENLMKKRLFNPGRNTGVVMPVTADQHCLLVATVFGVMVHQLSRHREEAKEGGAKEKLKLKQAASQFASLMSSKTQEEDVNEIFQLLTGKSMTSFHQGMEPGSQEVFEHLARALRCQISVFAFSESLSFFMREPKDFDPMVPQVHVLRVGEGSAGRGHYHGLVNADLVLKPLKRRFCKDCGAIATLDTPHSCREKMCYHCKRREVTTAEALALPGRERASFCWQTEEYLPRKCSWCHKSSRADALCGYIHDRSCRKQTASCQVCGSSISLAGIWVSDREKLDTDWTFLCCSTWGEEALIYCALCRMVDNKLTHYCKVQKKKRSNFQAKVASLYVTCVLGQGIHFKPVSACLVHMPRSGRQDRHLVKLYVSQQCDQNTAISRRVGQWITYPDLVAPDWRLSKDLLLPEEYANKEEVKVEPMDDSFMNDRSEEAQTSVKASRSCNETASSNASPERPYTDVLDEVISDIFATPELQKCTIAVHHGHVVLALIAARLSRLGVNFTHMSSGHRFKQLRLKGANITLVDIDRLAGPKAKASYRETDAKVFFPTRLSVGAEGLAKPLPKEYFNVHLECFKERKAFEDWQDQLEKGSIFYYWRELVDFTPLGGPGYGPCM